MHDGSAWCTHCTRLVEGDDRVEVAIAVGDEGGRLRGNGQLRARAHAREQARLQQPRTVPLYVLQECDNPNLDGSIGQGQQKYMLQQAALCA